MRHTPYHGVELTDKGVAIALEMLRHHRLIELFLAELLGMPWDRMHAEAERLEHVLSKELEERIAAKLGNPARDPHGDPIPTREGTIDANGSIALSDLPVGATATVVRVPDGDSALLQYLATLGLVPGAAIGVDGVAPYGDVLTLRIGARRHGPRRAPGPPRSSSQYHRPNTMTLVSHISIAALMSVGPSRWTCPSLLLPCNSASTRSTSEIALARLTTAINTTAAGRTQLRASGRIRGAATVSGIRRATSAMVTPHLRDAPSVNPSGSMR